MNWDAIGALGEILGAIAVLCSLVYLAIQIRGNTKQSRAAMVQAISRDFADGLDSFISHPSLIQITLKLGRGEKLSEEESVTWSMALNRVMNIYIAVQHAHDEEQLDTAYFETICQDVKRGNRSIPGWGDGIRKILEDFPDLSRKTVFRGLYEDHT